jgi:hypothetical protein
MKQKSMKSKDMDDMDDMPKGKKMKGKLEIKIKMKPVKKGKEKKGY